MYEKGAREPDFKTLELIADFFNVSIDYLLGRDKKSFSESDLSQEKSFTDTDVFFTLQIDDDSMEPRMKKGDILIARKQDFAESGDTIVVSIKGKGNSCKRLKKYSNGIALLSTNPSYEPIYFSKNEIQKNVVQIIGRVVELRAKY